MQAQARKKNLREEIEKLREKWEKMSMEEKRQDIEEREKEDLAILWGFDAVKDAIERAMSGGRNLFYYDAKPHRNMAILGSPIAGFKVKDVNPNEVINWLKEIANETDSNETFGIYGFWVLKEKREFDNLDDVLNYLSDLGYIFDDGVYWVADQIMKWFNRPPFILEWFVSITYTPHDGHLYVEDEFRIHWQPPPEEEKEEKEKT